LAGIYIHIPYCKQKCNYCNFHFSINKNNVDDMISSMVIELESRVDYLENKKIETIYFGGGTPSIINHKYIRKLLSKIRDVYSVTANPEITMEFNPDDIQTEKLVQLKGLGVNRLSIGIQSFNDKDLIFMNRSHNSQEAVDSVRIAQENGFKNITVDLIYGLPDQTNKKWEENLNRINELDIHHFSAYALTVEPKTELDFLIKQKKIKPLSDVLTTEHFKILQKKSEEMGYIQYEISNFCRNGKLSEHNSSYWKNKWYLGIGPSAHSYNGISRQWNIASNSKYITNIQNRNPSFEIEILNSNQMYNDYILTSLRTTWGVSKDYIFKNFGKEVSKHFLNATKKWVSDKKIKLKDGNYLLTKEGMLFADKISSDLFII
jgi:putative oxygen-independent coproporphyrinogen III oxidase